MALVGAAASTGEQEEFTLAHACTVLALELAHLRNLAEVELRLRRELVDDLITGTDDESACTRAAAVGHDLHGPHYPAVRPQVCGCGHCWPTVGMAVLVSQGRPRAEALHQVVVRELGSPTGSVGVGGRCDVPGIPRSFQEALRSLEVRQRSRSPNGTTAFDELGLYRILGPGGYYREVSQF
ncbi:PucR family transcriptional regulator [Streptomyces sp. NPDC002730]|uniref:PucR family transcriptional regulator n=1 Tax=Streptomyces sp. NPDC002730 TaxID=3364662 RepID=UPI00369F3E54